MITASSSPPDRHRTFQYRQPMSNNDCLADEGRLHLNDIVIGRPIVVGLHISLYEQFNLQLIFGL